MHMSKQWSLIVSIWLGVAVAATVALFALEDSAAWTAFSALLAGSIAVVSLLHVLKGSIAGAVREQVYVAAGSFLILAVATALTFLV